MEVLTVCTRYELVGAPFRNYFTNPEQAEAGIKMVLRDHDHGEDAETLMENADQALYAAKNAGRNTFLGRWM